MANLHMPERVVAVTKRPQREISGHGCFATATTRSGSFFSLIERFHCLSVTYAPTNVILPQILHFACNEKKPKSVLKSGWTRSVPSGKAMGGCMFLFNDMMTD
jgi:hypothetical protein